MELTSDLFQQLVPGVHASVVENLFPFLVKYLPVYEINTPQRIGGFIAQTREESINFSVLLEEDSGQAYEGNKMLGNTDPGDGVKYKGRGPIQITGKSMYVSCSKALFNDLRLLDNPELLEQPEYAAQSACWFWKDVKGLNVIADKAEDWTILSRHFGKTYNKIEWMTILINGGLNGIVTRSANYALARKVLNF